VDVVDLDGPDELPTAPGRHSGMRRSPPPYSDEQRSLLQGRREHLVPEPVGQDSTAVSKLWRPGNVTYALT
jgi:hypothetical protein